MNNPKIAKCSCGGEIELWFSEDGNRKHVRCEKCGISISGYEESANLIKRWNMLQNVEEMILVINGFLKLPTECNAVFLQRYYRWTDDAKEVLKKIKGKK